MHSFGLTIRLSVLLLEGIRGDRGGGGGAMLTVPGAEELFPNGQKHNKTQ